MLPGGGFVVLDTEVTAELEAEGHARDLLHVIQQARKDAGLEVSDRIALSVAGSAAVQDAARAHEQLVTSETLATAYSVAGALPDGLAGTDVLVGHGEKASLAGVKQ